jgi:aryl-alcohol dehydrogenase-like predicted oxidoreductase
VMRYKLLGHSGLRISELCLGTMTFGEDWGWGASQEESHRIFELFVEAGGNFIDTANNYTDGSSERIAGELIAPARERFVLATKYTLTARKDDPNGGGNSRKNLVQSLEGSLHRLRTDYVDLLWLHMWDGMTPLDEVLRALDDVVRAGKVLYVGFSDTPAWVISQAVMAAELRGYARPVAAQMPYSVLRRDPERDLLPMARALDLAVLAWAPLAGGVVTGKYGGQSQEPRRYGEHTVGEADQRVVEAVAAVARESGRSPAQVALGWMRRRQEGDVIIPIVGVRTVAQMRDNLGCLDLTLTPDQMRRLDEASGFRRGFPMDFLEDDDVTELIFGDTRPLIDTHRR